jgi:ankyrin repeat protein
MSEKKIGFAAAGSETTQERQAALDEAAWAAARDGKAKELGLLLAAGADPRRTDWHGEHWGATLLMLAAASGDRATVETLLPVSDLEAANQGARISDGETALLVAVRRNATGPLAALIEAGANLGAKTAEGGGALHIAAWVNAFDAIHLIAPLCDLDVVDQDGKTAEQLAESDGNDYVAEVLRLERARRERGQIMGALPEKLAIAEPRKPRTL